MTADAPPEEWTPYDLDALGEWVSGATPSKADQSFWTNGTVPWVSPKDMKVAEIKSTEDYIASEAVEQTGLKVVPQNSLLMVTRSGILKRVLPISLNLVPVTINQDLKALIPYEGVNSSFLRYQLLARTAEIFEKTRKVGITVESLDFLTLKKLKILLPSLREQDAIARTLDELFQNLQQSLVDISRAEACASDFLSSILQAAFAGKFLLANQAKWKKANLADLIEGITAGKNLRCDERPPKKNEKGVVKVSAVSWGVFKPQESKTLPKSFIPKKETQIQKGDLLLSRANTKELVGAAVVVTSDPKNLYLSDKVLRLEVKGDFRDWIHLYLRSPQGRKQLEARAHGTQASMLNIPQRDLLTVELSFPDHVSRNAILNKVARLLASRDVLLSEIALMKRRLKSLEGPILDLAMCGKLSLRLRESSEGESAMVIARPKEVTKSRSRRAKTEHHGAKLDDAIMAYLDLAGAHGLTFEELYSKLGASYEALQTAIFENLSKPQPRITQVFQKDKGQVRLVGRQ